MVDTQQRIGHIRLTETLGEGGMGTVWRGYDEKLRREVAVKTLRADRLDLQTRARLLAEARILSQLEHPNICRLYDYVEGEGNDYLVLELIRGRTLDSAIESGLANAEKLRIAEQIARTLVVAHARGIVHRDLKPSNVMLAESGDGQVKILDFGLARSVEGSAAGIPAERPPADAGSAPHRAAADGTLTRLGSIVLKSEAGRVTGTPAYMSPEQARGEGATAASDMYSFGLLLQMLFTGLSAYPPDLPVGRLLPKVGDGDTLPVEGTRRDVKALIDRLLALAPEERPAASEAAALVRAIRERPQRRRRWLAAAAVLAAFVIGAFKYAYDQKQGRDREAEARQEAERTTAFLADLFVAADPWQQEGDLPTVRQVLDRGRDRIARELADQPRVRGRLLDTLGVVSVSLRHHAEAEELLTEALEVNEAVFGSDSVEVAETLYMLGVAVHRQGRLEDAEGLYRRALESYESHPGQDPAEVARVLYDLANIYDQQGDPTRPEPLYQRALDILNEHPEPQDEALSTLLLNMGMYYRGLGKDDQAEQLLQRCLEIRERLRVFPGVAEVLNSLALLYVNRGDLARAEPLFNRALEIGEPVLGADDNLMIVVRHNFAILFLRAGELERAESLLDRVIESRRRNHHRQDLIAANTHILALVYSKQGRYREAEPLLRESLEVWGEARGEDHPRVGRMLSALAFIHRARGAPQEAEALLERAALIFSEALGEDDRYLTDARLELAGLALDRGAGDRSLELLRRARESTLRRLEGRPRNLRDQGRLAAVAFAMGEVEAARGSTNAAEEHWQEALAILEPYAAGLLLAEIRQTRALALLRLGRTATARSLVEDLLAGGWRDAELIESARAAGLRIAEK